jgi:hypothetical protein
MAAAEEEAYIPAAKLATDERLEWVPLSLTLVEYPQGNSPKESMLIKVICFFKYIVRRMLTQMCAD